MTTQQIGWLIVAGMLILFWLLFAVASTRKPAVANAIVVMQYGRVLSVFALIVALTPPTLMGTLAWHLPWRDDGTLAIAGVSFLAMSVGGLLLVEVARVRIILTEEGITRQSPWTGTVTMKWSEVERVRWSPYNRWFVVSSAAATIRVSRYLTGRSEFVQTVRRKVAAERWANAADELSR